MTDKYSQISTRIRSYLDETEQGDSQKILCKFLAKEYGKDSDFDSLCVLSSFFPTHASLFVVSYAAGMIENHKTLDEEKCKNIIKMMKKKHLEFEHLSVDYDFSSCCSEKELFLFMISFINKSCRNPVVIDYIKKLYDRKFDKLDSQEDSHRLENERFLIDICPYIFTVEELYNDRYQEIFTKVCTSQLFKVYPMYQIAYDSRHYKDLIKFLVNLLNNSEEQNDQKKMFCKVVIHALFGPNFERFTDFVKADDLRYIYNALCLFEMRQQYVNIMIANSTSEYYQVIMFRYVYKDKELHSTLSTSFKDKVYKYLSEYPCEKYSASRVENMLQEYHSVASPS